MSAAGQNTLANVARIAGKDLTLQVMNTNQFLKKKKCNIRQFSQMISTQQSNFSDIKGESEIERVTNKQRLEENGRTGLALVIPSDEEANVCIR